MSGFEVELKETVNPALAYVYDYSAETTCTPAGCLGILTRDGDSSENSRFSCTQPGPNPDEYDYGYEDTCGVTYRLYEPLAGRATVPLSSVYVAFSADSKTTLRVLIDDVIVVREWSGEEGSTALQEIPGLEGYEVDELAIEAVMEEGEWMGITEVEIYLELDEVPVTGVSASERVTVTATATVNTDSAALTLDGDTSEDQAWSCAAGDVCEITYDLEAVQSLEQIRIAQTPRDITGYGKLPWWCLVIFLFVPSLTPHRLVLSDVAAGARDGSATGDLQTFGGTRVLARYVKIEGTVSIGGSLDITEVEIRVKEDAPAYPDSSANSKWVETGLLPAGGNPASSSVSYHEKSASEGGCSAGRLDGCNIYNIKDGENTEDSRWSCGPQLGITQSNPCAVEFQLNTNRYVRQLQLAFHKGDERHNEFSVLVKQDEGYATIIPSAISSGDSLDFQTWDVKSYANAIQIRPKFQNVKDWMSIKEMVILEKKPSSSAVPAMTFSNSANFYDVGDTGTIRFVSQGDQTATLTAIKMKFPADEVFVFDITWVNDDGNDVTDKLTSAGGSMFTETADDSRVLIAAVEDLRAKPDS
eukprot:jgi/Undpi1/5147/HiC_scaffold_19.g08498.m1